MELQSKSQLLLESSNIVVQYSIAKLFYPFAQYTVYTPVCILRGLLPQPCGDHWLVSGPTQDVCLQHNDITIISLVVLHDLYFFEKRSFTTAL